MSALKTLGGALALLAEYDSLPRREANYRSDMWAGLLAGALGDLAADALGEAFENGQDRFACDLGMLLRDLCTSGRGEGERLRAAEEAIIARMELGLPGRYPGAGGTR